MIHVEESKINQEKAELLGVEEALQFICTAVYLDLPFRRDMRMHL